ncbi:conserved hypothetical protein [Candidatus Sulfotelmatobacter kueseliae]|uniref:Uncharacterized protein n=1 Tax=Candidatus Sulfotelmatobacter kueseliae TaxID=2042962 RepID=A0A2U3LDB5_9BACT|nr:conserved hypothetical protein [Candidatus Sulfotelmatobacter kueseliae]
MIFGFNTDVKHSDTIYHVQSEAREGERLLQTQVFVRGRCIGKKATSYAGKADEAPLGDAQKEQRLREQHRLVLDAIREGKLDSVLDRPEPEVLAPVKELEVEWLNAGSVHADRALTMQLRVTEGGAAAPGARLVFRFARPGAAPFYTQAVADSGGSAEIKIEVEEAALPDASLLVQANFEGRTATRKFVLRRAE